MGARGFNEDETVKVSDLATYTGQVFGEAARKVIEMMGAGFTFDDALREIRLQHQAPIRRSVTVTAHKITAYRIPQAVLDVAMGLAEGDISRLRIDPEDGTITVVNQSRKV